MIVALLTLWPAITAAQAPSPEERLGAAAAKWSADKPTAYEFTLRLVCFCPVLALSREPIVFRRQAVIREWRERRGQGVRLANGDG